MPDLTRFRDLHAGQRCVIVCNGPSLNRMDLGFLRREVVIGLNKIHLGLDRFGFYPRYLVAVNARVIAQSAADFAAMSCIRFISREGAAGQVREDAFTHLVRTRDATARFSRDITQGLREGGTVTYAALQIAHYMGFADVVLIGMDHRYVFTGKPHQAQVMEGPDPNHFSPAYFSGQTWDNPDLARSEESYAIARDIFAAGGRRIVDATLDGACTVFHKADHTKLGPPPPSRRQA